MDTLANNTQTTKNGNVYLEKATESAQPSQARASKTTSGVYEAPIAEKPNNTKLKNSAASGLSGEQKQLKKLQKQLNCSAKPDAQAPSPYISTPKPDDTILQTQRLAFLASFACGCEQAADKLSAWQRANSTSIFLMRLSCSLTTALLIFSEHLAPHLACVYQGTDETFLLGLMSGLHSIGAHNGEWARLTGSIALASFALSFILKAAGAAVKILDQTIDGIIVTVTNIINFFKSLKDKNNDDTDNDPTGSNGTKLTKKNNKQKSSSSNLNKKSMSKITNLANYVISSVLIQKVMSFTNKSSLALNNIVNRKREAKQMIRKLFAISFHSLNKSALWEVFIQSKIVSGFGGLPALYLRNKDQSRNLEQKTRLVTKNMQKELNCKSLLGISEERAFPVVNSFVGRHNIVNDKKWINSQDQLSKPDCEKSRENLNAILQFKRKETHIGR